MDNKKTVPLSPEALRKEATKLLKEAEDVEKRNEADLVKKKLHPVRLEILQTVNAVQKKVDEFIDCIDALNVAIQKLKNIQ